MTRESEHDPSQARMTPAPGGMDADAERAAQIEAAERALEEKRRAFLIKFGAAATEAALPEILEMNQTQTAEVPSQEPKLPEENTTPLEVKPHASNNAPGETAPPKSEPAAEKPAPEPKPRLRPQSQPKPNPEPKPEPAPAHKPEQAPTPERHKPKLKEIDGAGRVREAFETTKLFNANMLPEGTVSVGVTLDFKADDLAQLTPFLVKKVEEGGRVRGSMPDDLRAKVPALYDGGGMKIDRLASGFRDLRSERGKKSPPAFLHFDPEVIRKAVEDGLRPEDIKIMPAAATVDHLELIHQGGGGKYIDQNNYAKHIGIKGIPVVDDIGRLDRDTQDKQLQAEREKLKVERDRKIKERQRRRAKMTPVQRLLDDLFGDDELFGSFFKGRGQEAHAPAEPKLSEKEMEVRELIDATAGDMFKKSIDGLSVKEFKSVYRKLARDHHPDIGGDKDTFGALQALYERATTEAAEKK